MVIHVCTHRSHSMRPTGKVSWCNCAGRRADVLRRKVCHLYFTIWVLIQQNQRTTCAQESAPLLGRRKAEALGLSDTWWPEYGKHGTGRLCPFPFLSLAQPLDYIPKAGHLGFSPYWPFCYAWLILEVDHHSPTLKTSRSRNPNSLFWPT